MSSSIISPFPFFTDTTGAPLEGGYLYIGQSNLNPETAPVNVFWDAALTIPAPNPVRTVGGYPSRQGTPSRFYSATDTYSITVRNKNRALVFSAFDQSDSPTSVFDISTQLITSTAGQLTFTLTVFTYLPGTDTLQVFRNGLRLNLGLDYLETNSSTITLTAPAALGDQFLFQGGAVITGDQTPGSAVSFIQSGTGAVTRNIQEKARESVSVLDFGADPTGATDSTLQIQAAITAVQAQGGGTVNFSSGTFKCLNEIILNPIGPFLFHDVYLQGSGAEATILSFSSAVAGSNGIKVLAGGGAGRLGISAMSIKGAKNIGINVNPGHGPDEFISRFYISDVVVDGCVSDGVRFSNTYMGNITNVESRNNGGYGFKLEGFHTSMTFTRCWAGGDALPPNGGNTLSGWYIENVVYSSFDSCSADWNGGTGWTILGCDTLQIQACGAESNAQEGFFVGTNASRAVQNLTLSNCFAYNNAKSNPAGFANLLGVLTSGSSDARMFLEGCSDRWDAVGPASPSVVLNGTSGAIFYEQEGMALRNNATKTGNSLFFDRSLSGRITIANLSAPLSVPDATETGLAVTTKAVDTLGCTISGAGMLIPKGVTIVSVTAGLFWASNSTGKRTLRITKNTVTFSADARSQEQGDGFTPMSVTCPYLVVQEGDFIQAIVYQDSGAALNVVNNSATFLAIEAIA